MSGGYLYIRREELLREGRRKPLAGKLQDRRSTAVWECCPLTAREIEILQHLAEGLTNEGIARELGITRAAVVNFIQVARNKMGVIASPSGANAAVRMVAIAMREGWIQ